MAELFRGGAVLPRDAAYPAHVTSLPAGRLFDAGEPAWLPVPRVTWGPPAYRTTFRALWDDLALWVRFDARDDGPWHTLTRRDDRLWDEEVVEIFIDPVGQGRDYAEVEISPANVVCDLIVRTPWPALESDPGWTWPGLDSRLVTTPSGTAGDSGVTWTAIVRLPWEGVGALGPAAGGRVPPRIGDAWRANLFRIKRPHGPAEPERDAVFAAWSVPEGPSFHVPAAFRPLVFAGPCPGWVEPGSGRARM